MIKSKKTSKKDSKLIKPQFNKLKILSLLILCNSSFFTCEAALYQNDKNNSIKQLNKENLWTYGFNINPEISLEKYENEFLRALEAFRNNQFKEALARSKWLSELYPEKVDPLKLMAACYLKAGQWKEAKIELDKVIKLEPNEPSAIRNLAKVEMILGNSERARELLLRLDGSPIQSGVRSGDVSVLEEALKNKPDNLWMRAQLANEYMRINNFIKVLEVTLDLSDKQLQRYPVLFELKGKAQMLNGDLDLARATFKSWTKHYPNEIDAHFYYGDSLARSGDTEGASIELERIIILNPQYLPGRIGKIKLLMKLGKLKKAQKALIKLREDFGSRTEVLGIEGLFALGTSDFSQAEKFFSAARQQQPDSDLTVYLVRALWGQKKYNEAIILMQKWLKENPSDIAILLNLAGAYLSLERNNEAITTYSRVVAVNPDYFPALNNLAWLYRDKDLSRALEYAERAHRLSPKDPYILDTLAALELKNGNAERAYGLVKEAAKSLPLDGQIQLHLGQILLRQKRVSEARIVLEELVRQLPNTDLEKEGKALLNSISRE